MGGQLVVDSSSTHNFIDPQVAKLAKQQILKLPHLQVKVANGEKLMYRGICENSVAKIQGNRFNVFFHGGGHENTPERECRV